MTLTSKNTMEKKVVMRMVYFVVWLLARSGRNHCQFSQSLTLVFLGQQQGLDCGFITVKCFTWRV